jgi:hypothetical protein
MGSSKPLQLLSLCLQTSFLWLSRLHRKLPLRFLTIQSRSMNVHVIVWNSSLISVDFDENNDHIIFEILILLYD